MTDAAEQFGEPIVDNEPVNEPSVVNDSESQSDNQLTAEVESSGTESSGTGASKISMLFLMVSILFLASWFIGPRLVEEYQFASTKGKLRAEYENAVTILGSEPLKKVSMASQLVAHKVKPSVVSIWTIKLEGGDDPEYTRRNEVLTGFGSGVVTTSDGYIVTNAHVTEDAKEITVELHDRRSYRAVEVGRDETSDIAVLKIEVDGLTPATWGDSDKLEVGSIVWAVGSPYRYKQTVTSGIISAKDRIGERPEVPWRNPREKARSLLQTDAAINQGSSGGPLVNADGNVVGINVSIYGEQFQGISFAVPSTTAKFVYEQIVNRGKVVRGYLGVAPRKVGHQEAQALGLPDLEGAFLITVERGSPADLAGLRPRDVVRSWNEIPIHQYNSLYRLAERTEPGSEVEVSLIRNGQPHNTSVVIGEAPNYSSRIRRRRVRGRN